MRSITEEINNQQSINNVLSDKSKINTVTKDGKSALHIACENNDVVAAKTLVSKGANINATDCFKRTPLHTAGLSNS
jgi:ankyrin repeat protein